MRAKGRFRLFALAFAAVAAVSQPLTSLAHGLAHGPAHEHSHDAAEVALTSGSGGDAGAIAMTDGDASGDTELDVAAHSHKTHVGLHADCGATLKVFPALLRAVVATLHDSPVVEVESFVGWKDRHASPPGQASPPDQPRAPPVG